MATRKKRKYRRRRNNYRKIIVPMEIAVVVVAIVGVILFFSCDRTKDKLSVSSGQSGIYLAADNTVTYVIAEEFDKKYYDEDDLKEIIKDEVKSFNYSNDSSSGVAMSLEKLKIKNKTATATFNFATIEDFISYSVNYNNTEKENLFIGSIEEADKNKVSISGNFKSISNTGKTIEADELLKEDCNIVVVSEEMQIVIEHGIKFVSENVVIEDEKTVYTVPDEVSYIIY